MRKQAVHPALRPESNPISLSAEERVLAAAPTAADTAETETKGATYSPQALFSEPDLSTGLIIRNLLNDVDDLTAALKTAIERLDWLNAFLLAAGIWQIGEDYLHSDPLSLQRAEKVFEGLNHPLIRITSSSVRLARNVETGVLWRLPRHRYALRWSIVWKEFVEKLAEAVVSVDAGQSLSDEKRASLAEQSRVLLAASNDMPSRLRRSILKLPNCFRSFDQKPEDLERLAVKFAKQYPDRKQAVVVVGLRTSGSYLAPLLKGYLHREGYRDITLMTLRPGIDLLPVEKAQIRHANRQGALFVVVDDPPVIGKSVLRAARHLEHVGVSTQSIVLMVPLLAGVDTLPARLKGYKNILLPSKEWAIQTCISPEAVQNTLSGWLRPGLGITHIEPVALMTNDTDRGHIARLYRVIINEAGSHRKWRRNVFIKGVGLGYLGQQVQDALVHLSPYLPTIYGLHDGLLFRAWFPEEAQFNHSSDLDSLEAAREIVAYIWERHQRLSVPEDTSLRRFGNSPAWEVASDLISHVFGRACKIARVPLVDPVMRRLMRAPNPSIVDGNMGLSNWFYQPTENRLNKVAFERGVFRNDVEFTSYDPVFDVASLAADLDVAAVEGQEWAKQLFSLIRSNYERLAGEKIDEERWLLYQLVRLWEVERTTPVTRTRLLRRAYSRAFQRYFSAHFFPGLPANPQGEVCAFDLDGVLETNYLRKSQGYPALTPASALSLRALAVHGYRSILATGRSLPEVIERCQLYPVVGGVAEYGAVIYSPANGTRVLLSEPEQDALADLRRRLQAQPSIFIDPDYRYAVRAYQVDALGRRVGLSADQIASVLRSCPPACAGIYTIPGEEQTDFMATGIDKAVGVRELLRDLKTSREGTDVDPYPLALAVGDSLTDLPVLRMAKRAAIPAHASPQLNRPGIRRYGKAYQAGLAQAVTDLVRRSPRGREECRPIALADNARQLLALFAVQENGTKSLLSSLIPWKRL